jgi:hypothetical protein
MSIKKPYRRTVRQLCDGSYARSGNGEYVNHKAYARDSWHFKRAFQIIDNDIQDIFTYIEPSDLNLGTFSYRILGIFTRICVEIEANFKAILRENGYSKPGNWNIKDYCKVNKSHYLSHYEAKIPTWDGSDESFKPFAPWAQGESLPWYQIYNQAKHDRHENFRNVNFRHLVESYCALAILIYAQFRSASSPGPSLLSLGTDFDLKDFEFGPLHHTLLRLPNIPYDERYEFNWQLIKEDLNPFENFHYDDG